MSREMKILLGILGAIVAAAVVLTMLGKPPNLPLGPLKGVLASDEAADTTAAGEGAVVADAGTGIEDCIPGSTDPGTGVDGTVDPAAGPADGTAVDPGAADQGTSTDISPGTIDPATGAPVAAPAEGTAPDRLLVADVVDPATGTAADPAAMGTATDPATGVVDPCADQATGTGTAADPAAADPATDGAGTATGSTGGSGPSRATTDGTNEGNSPEALRIAKDASVVMQKANIQVSSTATLVPSAGGIGTAAAVKRYRKTVTAAVLVLQLDSAALQEWSSAGAGVQRNLVRSFLTRLGKTYGKATRSVTVVDSSGTVLAVGDAAARKPGTVKVY